MSIIGIIGAMEEEVAALKEKMQLEEVKTKYKIVTKTLYGKQWQILAIIQTRFPLLSACTHLMIIDVKQIQNLNI